MEFSFDTGNREMKLNDDEAAMLDEISIVAPEK